jgi:nucleotide-binding universal stress UspA family protein
VGVARVGKTCSQTTPYLALDRLAANPRLARRLPADLACRFHALPLTEEYGRITVAMADPSDAAARTVIAAALGSESCIVQADLPAIDALLAEIWGRLPAPALDLGVCGFSRPVSGELWHYAQALAGLLHARLTCLDSGEGIDALSTEGARSQRDLLLIGDPEEPLFRQRLRFTPGGAPDPQGHGLPLALLAARQPRWPLKSILLLICGEEGDGAALGWVLRLARQSESAVTVLAIVPPVPAMYGQRMQLAHGLPALLTAGSSLGQQMRRVARSLVDWEIEGTLRLRQGPPDWQVRRELAAGDYDLIAMADRPCRWWQSWLEGDLIGQLLRWVDRPLLIAKGKTEE